MDFMCATSSLDGVCRSCPPGWTASGAFCVECDPLKSCDRNGTAACDGACAAGRFPTCDPATRRVSCQGCTLNLTALAEGRRSLTRGGVLDAPELCAAYFKCDAGYYLATQASNGELACLPCSVPEPSQAGWAFLSRGLTFGDKFSCLYAPVRPRLNDNSFGEYGSPLRSCPVGKTSEPGMALLESHCVACPLQPEMGGFGAESPVCRPTCDPGYEQRGEACVLSDHASLDCDREGYVVDSEGSCAPAPLPWSPPGWQASPEVDVVVSLRGEAWAAVDAEGDFRVLRATGALARPGVPDFCAELGSAIQVKGYVQDKPLFTQACRDLESHKLYHLASAGPAAKYLYAFLERPFGNNNRFVMWQVQRAVVVPARGNPGQVWQTFRLPAKACSAVVVPGEYVYLALCGSTFISYVKQLDYMQSGADPDNPPFTLEGTQYVLGRRTGVLIGQEASGSADGMVGQALFRGPLSLAATSDPRRLLVADLGGCRIVEVSVDQPGSFLTRATTVGSAGCFSGEFPLPYPRAIVSVLGGAAALFVTDQGLVQLDARMRRFALVLGADQLRSAVGEPRWIRVEQDGGRVVLDNETHSAALTRRLQGACPGREMSRRGGACAACATGTYSTGGACAPCSTPTCGEGFKLVPCADSADARCEACTETATYFFRYGEQCQIVPKYPCPPDFYGLDDCYPCSAKTFRQWPAHAYCQCLGFPLGVGGTCALANPWPAVPEWLPQLRCDYRYDANCSSTACYLASVQPRECAPCPAGDFTSDGLHCEPCPGFRQPSQPGDSCVCRDPASASDDGASCVCPPGHSAGGPEGCAPCPPGTIKPLASQLPEDYAGYQFGGCSFCPPGTEPTPGSQRCSPCRTGWYREGVMPRCEPCAVGVAHATDPASAASCLLCAEQCGPGQQWDPCPVNSSYFACSPCPALPKFRELVPGGSNCEWRCAENFYEYNGDCFPCTKAECEPGFAQTQCTRYEDAHCRVPCKSETKPEEHSVWLNDCYWDCEAGYTKILKEYPGWMEFACVNTDPLDLPWSVGV